MDETYWRRVDSTVTDTKETSVLIFQETEDVTFFYEYALLVSYGGATVEHGGGSIRCSKLKVK